MLEQKNYSNYQKTCNAIKVSATYIDDIWNDDYC